MAKMYKGFDKNLKCRDFQYEIGKTYETEEAEICKTGFHACEMPLDVMRYYIDRFAEVDLDANDQAGDDTKRVGKKIEIKTKLSLAQLIRAQIEFVREKVEAADEATSGYFSTAATSGNRSTAVTSGNRSTAATSGDGSTAATSGRLSTAATSGYFSTAATSRDKSTAATSGYKSTAATSGYCSTAATSGHWSTAATSGHCSTAATSGKDSVAVAWGYQSKAKGAVGSYIVLSEFNNYGNLVGAKMRKVDGKRIKADTLYTLQDGKFVEVKE